MHNNYSCLSCGTVYPSLEIESTLFLVRHGETDWNKIGRIQGHMDTPLNETGIAQAKATAEQFRGEHINFIISSDLARAKQTAEIIAEATGAELILDASFREMKYGVIDGMLIHEVNEKYGQFHERPYKELGGESFAEVEERAMRALHNHRKRYHHKNVVIVTHGALLGVVMKNIRNITHEKSAGMKIGNAEAIRLEIGEPCKVCGGDFYESERGRTLK
jgi:broad specificity phosphatase PhoE